MVSKKAIIKYIDSKYSNLLLYLGKNMSRLDCKSTEPRIFSLLKLIWEILNMIVNVSKLKSNKKEVMGGRLWITN